MERIFGKTKKKNCLRKYVGEKQLIGVKRFVHEMVRKSFFFLKQKGKNVWEIFGKTKLKWKEFWENVLKRICSIRFKNFWEKILEKANLV